MSYQEALAKFRLLCRVDVGAYFCMGAYKRDVVVVIKMGI